MECKLEWVTFWTMPLSLWAMANIYSKYRRLLSNYEYHLISTAFIGAKFWIASIPLFTYHFYYQIDCSSICGCFIHPLFHIQDTFSPLFFKSNISHCIAFLIKEIALKFESVKNKLTLTFSLNSNTKLSIIPYVQMRPAM